MDIAALVREGRQSEVFARLEPLSKAGDHAASRNLSLVYRQIGDSPLEQFYALRAYQQNPSSAIGLASLFRTLMRTGQQRLLLDIYAAFPNKGALHRDEHLSAALCCCRTNRIAQADEALARVPGFPADIRELEIAVTRAGAGGDHQGALRLMDELESRGVDVESRRIGELFAANKPAEALRRFEAHRATNSQVAAMAKVAMFCALLIGDREKVAAFAPAMRGDARALADGYLAGVESVEVRGETRTYRFPFTSENLSITMPHALGGFYEIETLKRLKAFLAPGDQVVDVGANVGNHTIYFAGEAGCRVLPFECNPKLTPRLTAVVESAGLSDLVDLGSLGLAVSDAREEVEFNFLRDDFSNISKTSTSTSTAGAARVPAITLDSLTLTACRLLKIDVDGGEMLVLRGAERFIGALRPIIAIEVSNFNTTAVQAFMHRHGYVCAWEDFHPTVYGDFLFIPSEAEIRVP